MNTASAIRSAVAGRSERLQHRLYSATGLGEVFNDSNVHLSVKSSPEKTVLALSPLAEKEGTVVKLNDSGCWRKRRALLVPHTFLYYFAENTAETDLRPHGVIDLLLYTDVEVVDETVKLAPGDEMSPVRTFYLRMSSTEEAEAWAQAIRETRFDCVRGERDALRSAKTCLAEQLRSRAEELHECRESLAASRRRESAALSEVALRNADEARRVEQVRALLAASASASIYGNRSDFDSSSTGNKEEAAIIACVGQERDINGSRSCWRDGSGPEVEGAGGLGLTVSMASAVVGGRSSVAATALSELAALEEAIAERAQEVASLKVENAALREREALAVERRNREVAEALELRDQERERADGEAALRSDLEAELQHLRGQLGESRAGWEEARTNLGVVAAACREADAKSRELQEHRRVLAREVKASRAEQRRLSAALSCATAAAATAAARAKAARAEVTAANAAAAAAAAASSAAAASNPAGNRHRSSSAASWAAGDGCASRDTALVSRLTAGEEPERGEEHNDGGATRVATGGGTGDDSTEQGDNAGAKDELPLRPSGSGGDAGWSGTRAGTGTAATLVDEGVSLRTGSSSSSHNELPPGRSSGTAAISDSSDAGEPGCIATGDDTGAERTAVDGRSSALSLWVLPSDDGLGAVEQQGGGKEGADGSVEECALTCPPETESPAGASDGGGVSDSGSVGGWRDADDGREGGSKREVLLSCSSSSSSVPAEGVGGAARFGEERARASSPSSPAETLPAAERPPSTNVNISVAGTAVRRTRGGTGDGGSDEDCDQTCANGREHGPGASVDKEGGGVATKRNCVVLPPPLSPSQGEHRLGTMTADEDGSGRDASPLPRPPPTATAEAPASPSTSLAAAFGESSSLRFNQMVQSLSAGLRESRKARRTPLLGSLDNDDDDDDDYDDGFGGSGGGLSFPAAAAVDADEDDGGVTDGTGTDGTGIDGGDSHHDSITTAVTGMTRKDSGGAWSAWSTVGRGGSGSCRSRGSSCHDEPSTKLANKEEGELPRIRYGASAAAVDVGEREPDKNRCTAPLDGRDESICAAGPVPPIPTAGGSVSGPTEVDFAPASPPTPPSSPLVTFPTSAADAAVKKTSEWLRVLGRPDGEEADQGSEIAAAEQQEAPPQAKQQRRRRQENVDVDSMSSPPPKDETEARGEDIDYGSERRRDGDRVDGDRPSLAAPPPSSSSSSSTSSSAVNAHVDADDEGVGGAAVAVALAAAERGGRASAEAAAAARRWEAKLKGSLVSMAGGVRWGMGPQRVTDASFFKS